MTVTHKEMGLSQRDWAKPLKHGNEIGHKTVAYITKKFCLSMVAAWSNIWVQSLSQ